MDEIKITALTLFKALNGRESCHNGSHRWRLRAWTPEVKPVQPCLSGYHLCRGPQILHWLSSDLYVAEIHPDAEIIECDTKLVVSRCRIIRKIETWSDRTSRLFACDCADQALCRERKDGRHVDPRSSDAIRVARAFANGRVGCDELDAARAAAVDAAGSAARAAAGAAEGAAERAASSAAARAAASAAEWAAVSAAAVAAAVAAAGAAGWAAESAAARAAERKWQWVRIRDYLNGKIG